MRTRDSFDQGWTFYLGDISIPESVKAGMASGLTDVAKREEGKHTEIAFIDKQGKAQVDPATWRKLDLPHDWCIEGDLTRSDSDADKSHGYLPRGVGFYRKVFSISEASKGQKVVLEFDGVFRNCRLWLNGQIVMDHRSGYTSFQVDLTDNLRYGAEGENCLLVRVDATDTEGWWYEGCGIYRHVWLRQTERVHVGHWGTYVTTPAVSEASARVHVETTVENNTGTPAAGTLRSTIQGKDGSVHARVETAFSAGADGSVKVAQDLDLKAPQLWSPDSPSLYTLVSELVSGDQVLDRYESTFGVRKIEFTADGFLLNGKPTVIKGTCNHQDFAGVGVALTDNLHEFKIRKLKAMGSNAYRCSHHPPAPELLNACDRLGMLVMDENRQLDSSAKGLADLESMILRDRNHPSVILWSMENEEPLQGTERGARLVETLVRRTRRLDPTRPTVSAMNHGYDGGGYAEKMDLTGFNYGHKDGDTDVSYRQRHPGRLMIGTENAACCTTRGVYETDPAKGHLNAYGSAATDDAWLALWTAHYEVSWKSLLKHPFLTGMFVWTGFDYRGEPSPYAWPCIHSHFGIMDTCGFPKDEYYYYKANWSDEPMLHLLPHWNWAGKEGQRIKVWCFSNCAEVELFLNGKSLGQQTVVREGHLEWMVAYAPGELKAVGRGGAGGSLESIVRTTGAPASLRLVSELDGPLRPGDALPVRAEVVDAQGLVVPGASNLVSFTTEGPGSVIGVGNGDPSCLERDKASQRSAFHGLCLAVLQGSAAGTLRLRAESPGLKAAELETTFT